MGDPSKIYATRSHWGLRFNYKNNKKASMIVKIILLPIKDLFIIKILVFIKKILIPTNSILL